MLSYIIIILAVLLFFGVCCFIFRPASHRKGRPTAKKIQEKEIVWKGKPVPEEAESAPVSDKTQVFTRISPAQSFEDDEKTKVFSRPDTERLRASSESMRSPVAPAEEPEPVIVDDVSDPAVLETYFVRHFLNRYGAVSYTVKRDTETVTHRAVEKLQNRVEDDIGDVLSHIMVQEALQNAQRTYVMLPNETILEMVTDAFCDVGVGRRTETRTLLAYDALKAMPRMEEEHFRALALLLLFHYSRNTDNVNEDAFRRYARRYIEPFMEKLPDEYSGYQQMEYLHCITLSNKDTAFGQVLRDSYPLIFSFRGCMESELKMLHPSWPNGTLVKSFFNSYYKLPVIDDSMLPQFFDTIGIEDRETQESITGLLHSRPVGYDRAELTKVLEKISPAMAGIQEIWDTSMLRRSALTLMGMYIAQAYVKEVIGEAFDLSHWM